MPPSATSRSAASGGMREARTAGNTAEHDGDERPDDDRDDAVRGCNTVPPAGMSIPNCCHHRLEQPGHEHAGQQTDQRTPRGRRRTPRAAGRRAPGARVAPTARSSAISRRALGDDDLERVVDREAGDDETDRGEHEQERVEEAQPSCDRVLRLLGDLPCRSAPRSPSGRTRRRAPSASSSVDAVGGVDHHGVELAGRAEQHLLGGGQVEDRRRWRRRASRPSRTGRCRRAGMRADRSG